MEKEPARRTGYLIALSEEVPGIPRATSSPTCYTKEDVVTILKCG
jgi:hypothetical protein